MSENVIHKMFRRTWTSTRIGKFGRIYIKVKSSIGKNSVRFFAIGDDSRGITLVNPHWEYVKKGGDE